MNKPTNEMCKRFVLLSQKNVKGLLTDANEIAEWKELRPLCIKDKRCLHPLFENEGTNKGGVKFFMVSGRIHAEKNGEDFGTIGRNGDSWEASTKELNDYILMMSDYNAFYYSWNYLSGWILAQN